MRVTHLSLSDYRNYESAEVPLEAGLNLVLGRNGQGKTNLAEAISYFSILGSHRVNSDAALIRAGQSSAVMRMRVMAREREALLELQLNREKPNRAQINRNSARPREVTRWFSSVLFAPEDLSLVRGEPAGRRRFLDEAVIARNPSFAATISDYERVVRQRTALLKSARAVGGDGYKATLQIWNERLVELGATIMLARRDLVSALETPLREAYAAIVQENHNPALRISESVHGVTHEVSRETSMVDQPGTDALVSRETLVAEFISALQTVEKQELDRAVTLVGPHRDDLVFELNSLPVKGYASHGETWSFALGLRLSLARLLREESPSGDPVIILDDVFAELDERRRAALMREVAEFEQVIVTAAVEGDVPTGDWNTIHVHQGKAALAGEP